MLWSAKFSKLTVQHGKLSFKIYQGYAPVFKWLHLAQFSIGPSRLFRKNSAMKWWSYQLNQMDYTSPLRRQLRNIWKDRSCRWQHNMIHLMCLCHLVSICDMMA